MKAEELRIGNFVEYDKKICFIAEILKDDVVRLYDGYGFDKITKLIEPILLTEEWLVNLGFKQDEELDYRWYIEWCGCVVLKYDLDDYCIKVSDSWEFGKREFVHQLQNLYHALTGEELTIKTK
jgi:hypothetical protein